jgi:hypothetical protein
MVKAVNLSNCVDNKSDLKQLTTNGNVSEWKKLRYNKHTSNQSKRILNDLKQHTSHNLLTKNRFEPLSDHQNQGLQCSCDQTKSKTLSGSTNSDFNKHRIIVLGDSHVRGCSEKLANILGNAFSVIRITKLNAKVSVITNSTNLKAEKLSKKGVVIICGGTRDVAKNETKEGLRSIAKFARRTVNTNVIMMCIPRCFDL